MLFLCPQQKASENYAAMYNVTPYGACNDFSHFHFIAYPTLTLATSIAHVLSWLKRAKISVGVYTLSKENFVARRMLYL
jgi:hypothetical protein